jgi:hypothetical protein
MRRAAGNKRRTVQPSINTVRLFLFEDLRVARVQRLSSAQQELCWLPGVHARWR